METAEQQPAPSSVIKTLKVKLPASGQEVEVRRLTVKEIDVLASPKSQKTGSGLQQMLKNCVVSKETDTSDLLKCDDTALMFAIRRCTFGDHYDFRAKCPECGEKAVYTIDLSDLDVLPGNLDIVSKFNGDSKYRAQFRLPYSEKVVWWKLMRSSDQAKVMQVRRKHGDSLASAYLKLKISKVDGVDQTKHFLENMDAEDLQAFNEYYEECEPGFDDKVDLFCENGACGEDFQLAIPLDPENFFKRSARKKSY